MNKQVDTVSRANVTETFKKIFDDTESEKISAEEYTQYDMWIGDKPESEEQHE